MKFSDFFGKAWSFASTAGHALGVKEVFDLFKSTIPTSETLRSKGWYGILGLGDEQDFQVLLLEIKKISLEYRNAIVELVDFLYPAKKGDHVNNIIHWYYRGKLRQFVLGLPKTGPEIRVAKETLHHKDGGRIEHEVPIFVDGGVNYPKEYLVDLAKEICDAGGSKSKERRAAMRQIKKRFASGNVPLPPEGYKARKREAYAVASSLSGVVKNAGAATGRAAKTLADVSVRAATAAVDQTRSAVTDFHNNTETSRRNESRIDRFLREWM